MKNFSPPLQRFMTQSKSGIKMIKNWLLTGDTHGKVYNRLMDIVDAGYEPAETAVIILGDVGFNFYLNKSDYHNKQKCNEVGMTIYCLHGNHEEHPKVLGYPTVYDELVQNDVYIQDEFPNIKYLVDGKIYHFGKYSALCIGGAYSVDKFYRIANYSQSNGWSGWFPSEELTKSEMNQIMADVKGVTVDFMFTHTAPYTLMPVDLFLPQIDQKQISKEMEYFLDDIKKQVTWKYWCFGHYHKDRVESPYVEQFYFHFESLDEIVDYWAYYDNNQSLKDWWSSK